MKQSEHKANIIQDLEALGFKIKNDQYSKRIGKFTVLIFLSKQSRVLIETDGVGSYYIILEQEYASYSDTTAKKLIKTFERYVRKCEAFESTK